VNGPADDEFRQQAFLEELADEHADRDYFRGVGAPPPPLDVKVTPDATPAAAEEAADPVPVSAPLEPFYIDIANRRLPEIRAQLDQLRNPKQAS